MSTKNFVDSFRNSLPGPTFAIRSQRSGLSWLRTWRCRHQRNSEAAEKRLGEHRVPLSHAHHRNRRNGRMDVDARLPPLDADPDDGDVRAGRLLDLRRLPSFLHAQDLRSVAAAAGAVRILRRDGGGELDPLVVI